MSGMLNGKIAVITGGTAGIGLATATRFVAEGAQVVIVGRRQAELDKAVADLGVAATGVRADISDLRDLERLYKEVARKHGRVGVLVANAAILEPEEMGSITEDSVDRMLAINLKGLVHSVQGALPLIADGGSIVITSSADAINGGAGRSVYAATKAAARNLARSWFVELADRGIRVNAVSPGTTETPGLAALGAHMRPDEFFAVLAGQSPVGRNIKPDEVAAVIAFVASDQASGINGADIPVDAGLAQI